MDFESPDVEREFPGLYASESGKRSQESDFSDEAHERPSKKDLLIGKRKDKKESKKDQGYAALEGESSPEEDLDVKSPSKSKKSKSFKFPTIKEKREKSREKDVKEKDKEREKEKDQEKEKKKESKSKLKLKDKKKSKHVDDGSENIDDMPVFGVPIAVAVERNHCHDGIAIPVILRDCIDYVQECGLSVEGIYKVSGVKSKVQQLKRCYNRREYVNLADYDLSTATSLFKTFFRELPDPLLTTDLASKFEETVGIKEPASKEEALASLITQLPHCNQICLAWIMRHLENIASHERQNKMGVSALSATLGPALQMSSRLTGSLISFSRALFPDIKMTRYIPPLSTNCSVLPNSCETIASELAKQESLLTQIHSEMNHGYTIRSEQLWEVQRFITQLKRKMKSLEKAQESSQQIHDEPQSSSGTSVATVNTPVVPSSSSGEVLKESLTTATAEICLNPDSTSDMEESSCGTVNKTTQNKTDDEVDSAAPIIPEKALLQAGPGLEDKTNQMYLELEQRELLQLISDIRARIYHERETVETLQKEVSTLQTCIPKSSQINSDLNVVEKCDNNEYKESENKEKEELLRQHTKLMQDRSCLIQQIMNERDACIRLKVELGFLQVSEGKYWNEPSAVVSDIK